MAVNSACSPLFRLLIVQLPVFAGAQLGPELCVNEDRIEPVGAKSAKRTFVAVSGPLFPTTSRTDTDRKSTRLNSSHRCISYAVFCLKKKKCLLKTTRCTASTT